MARAPGAGAFTRAHAWLLRKMRIRPRWFGSDVILLEVLGRKTGQLRRSVVVAVAIEEGWIVASANGGLNSRPSWAYNLEQSTTAVVFDRAVRCEIEAELLAGEAAAPFWTQYLAKVPIVSQYQAMTSRDFDLFLLRRVYGSRDRGRANG